MSKFQPGDEVFGKFGGMEAVGTVVGTDPILPGALLVQVDGEDEPYTAWPDRITRASGEA